MHIVSDVRFEKSLMTLNVDGKWHIIHLADVSFKLLEAPEHLRNEFQISASGYGIHWPLLDEDLSIDALLQKVSTSIIPVHPEKF